MGRRGSKKRPEYIVVKQAASSVKCLRVVHVCARVCVCVGGELGLVLVAVWQLRDLETFRCCWFSIHVTVP